MEQRTLPAVDENDVDAKSKNLRVVWGAKKVVQVRQADGKWVITAER